MKKIKLILIMIVLAFLLSFGNPVVTGASSSIILPPAIVLVQDKNNKMLVKHNFVYDQSIFVPGDTQNDPGFYVNIPAKR